MRTEPKRRYNVGHLVRCNDGRTPAQVYAVIPLVLRLHNAFLRPAACRQLLYFSQTLSRPVKGEIPTLCPSTTFQAGMRRTRSLRHSMTRGTPPSYCPPTERPSISEEWATSGSPFSSTCPLLLTRAGINVRTYKLSHSFQVPMGRSIWSLSCGQ